MLGNIGKLIKQYLLFFVCITLSFTLLIAHKNNHKWLAKLNSKFYDHTTHIFESTNKAFVSIKTVFSDFSSTLSIKKLYIFTKQENLFLKEEIARLQVLKAENIRLKQLLNFVTETEKEVVTNYVINKSYTIPTDEILIRIDKNTHIKKWQPAINHFGLVGRVIEVGERTAKIMLVTDFRFKIPAITNDSRNVGMIVGDGNNLIMKYLQDNTDIKIGEAVITKDDGDYLPAGIPIGIVIAKDKTDQIKVKPYLDKSKLDLVSIIQIKGIRDDM